jgi:S1-C subfamily serine protease
MGWKLLQVSAILAALLAGCEEPAPDTSLRLVTIESVDARLSLRELPPHTLKGIGLSFGLAVIRAGGLAERAGLKVGDVIYGVNHKKAASLEEFHRLLAGGGRVGLLVRRGATDFYVAVDLAGAARDGMPKGLPASKETLLRT